ncbi:hypothetical protein KCV03_g359, partial [Aureobasidium melanogenum]
MKNKERPSDGLVTSSIGVKSPSLRAVVLSLRVSRPHSLKLFFCGEFGYWLRSIHIRVNRLGASHASPGFRDGLLLQEIQAKQCQSIRLLPVQHVVRGDISLLGRAQASSHLDKGSGGRAVKRHEEMGSSVLTCSREDERHNRAELERPTDIHICTEALGYKTRKPIEGPRTMMTSWAIMGGEEEPDGRRSVIGQGRAKQMMGPRVDGHKHSCHNKAPAASRSHLLRLYTHHVPPPDANQLRPTT